MTKRIPGLGRLCESLCDLNHIAVCAIGLGFFRSQATTAGAFDGKRNSCASGRVGEQPTSIPFRILAPASLLVRARQPSACGADYFQSVENAGQAGFMIYRSNLLPRQKMQLSQNCNTVWIDLAMARFVARYDKLAKILLAEVQLASAIACRPAEN